MLRPVKIKSLEDICSEWDALAAVRQRQINSGEDISYTRVIAPAILNVLQPLRFKRILDAGCGIGALTAQLSELAVEVVGVDPSKGSIDLAKARHIDRTTFVHSTVEAFAQGDEPRFDAVVANMVLMDVLSLSSFLGACARLLSDSGLLVFSITHPCFWPGYYGYASADWFRYEDEIIVESEFRISADPVGSLVSTHVHRPLSAYISTLREAGFCIRALQEPTPPHDVARWYSRSWKLPRYMVGVCLRS